MHETTPGQRWVPVKGFEPYYLISEHGHTYSVRTGKILKPSYSNTGGYPMVIFTVNGIRTPHYNHVLTAEAFIGECPEGEEVRHKDRNVRNPAADNLEYGTSSDNKHDQVRDGTHYEGSKECCDNGHEFTPKNTRICRWPDGTFRQRACRACHNDKTKERRRLLAETAESCTHPDGCDRPQWAKKLCEMHYAQQWRANRTKRD
jgi:HNH endonuclease/NUMOD4 motif